MTRRRYAKALALVPLVACLGGQEATTTAGPVPRTAPPLPGADETTSVVPPAGGTTEPPAPLAPTTTVTATTAPPASVPIVVEPFAPPEDAGPGTDESWWEGQEGYAEGAMPEGADPALLACIRSYEGDYGTETGNGHSGAYQFSAGTWPGAVGRAGYPQYADGLASQAPPHVQDAAAWQLYTERGLQPWPPATRYCR